MKLVMAIIRDEYSSDVSAALNAQGLRVTRISSTGGFWRRGNVTLLLGLEEEQVEPALAVIDKHAGPEIDPSLSKGSHPPSRATVFVLDVAGSERY